MANINLVPEVKKEQAKVKKTNLTVTVTAIGVAGIFIAAILVLLSMLTYRNASIDSVNKKIDSKKTELKAYAELESSVLTLENGLKEIKTIIGGGRDWTAFFGDIEKATPGDIQFTGFKVSGNTIEAEVFGKDVSSIDRFIKSFSAYKDENGADMFSSVKVDGYSAKESGGVTFKAVLTIAEN